MKHNKLSRYMKIRFIILSLNNIDSNLPNNQANNQNLKS